MKCAACGNDNRETFTQKTRMALDFMGNEYCHEYWFCQACDQWTMHGERDNYDTGGTEKFHWGPFPKDVGDHAVALVATCPDPMNERCHCDAHNALLHGPPTAT